MDFDVTFVLVAFTLIGSFSGITGYFLMKSKFQKQLALSVKNQEELARRVYEISVLKEIGERIGYSLDGAKIVEIISGSLGGLLPYSTVSYIIVGASSEKVIFQCNVKESVSPEFVKEVKAKVFAAVSEMTQKPLLSSEIDESITGVILDEKLTEPVKSYFNLPIVVLGKLVGLINVASVKPNLYNDENSEVLYKIARQASDAVSKLKEVLENEKGRLTQAVQSLADGLMMVDTNYRLLFANRRLCQLLSVVENPRIFDIINALSGQLDLRSKMEETLAQEVATAPVDIVVRDKVLQVFASRVLDKKSGKPIAIVVLFQDITDAKKLEQLRQDFTAMMVHELRAPLTSIKSSTELIKGESAKATADQLAHYFSIIETTSQSMLELVADLLDVAKIEAGKFDVVPEPGDLAGAVLERVDSFKPVAQNKNLKLTLNIAEALPEAKFDKIRIKQVLNNLLSNAIKYTDAGEITVKVGQRTVDSHPVDILVSVTDTGVGIEPDQVEKLFSKFGQLESGRKQALKSSGLGLYIAKGIVEAWGGKIWVESQGAKMGSTFCFTVPQSSAKIKSEPMVLGATVNISKVAHA